MPFYTGDYRKDTSHLKPVEHAAYLMLLFAYWDHGGPLPCDSERLRRAAQADLKGWPKVMAVVATFFEEVDGHWVHHRVELELAKAKARSEIARSKGKASGAARKRTGVEPELNRGSTGVELELSRGSTGVEPGLNSSYSYTKGTRSFSSSVPSEEKPLVPSGNGFSAAPPGEGILRDVDLMRALAKAVFKTEDIAGLMPRDAGNVRVLALDLEAVGVRPEHVRAAAKRCEGLATTPTLRYIGQQATAVANEAKQLKKPRVPSQFERQLQEAREKHRADVAAYEAELAREDAERAKGQEPSHEQRAKQATHAGVGSLPVDAGDPAG